MKRWTVGVARVRDPDGAVREHDAAPGPRRSPARPVLAGRRRLDACERRVAERCPDEPPPDVDARVREVTARSRQASGRSRGRRRVDPIERAQAAVHDPDGPRPDGDAVGRSGKRDVRDDRKRDSGSTRRQRRSSRLRDPDRPAPAAIGPGRMPTGIVRSRGSYSRSIAATEFGEATTTGSVAADRARRPRRRRDEHGDEHRSRQSAPVRGAAGPRGGSVHRASSTEMHARRPGRRRRREDSDPGAGSPPRGRAAPGPARARAPRRAASRSSGRPRARRPAGPTGRGRA